MADPADTAAQPAGVAGTVHHVQRPSTDVARVVTPSTLAAALAAVSDPSACPIAGGTDLMIELDRGQHRSGITLVDLTRIDGLNRIEHSSEPSPAGTVTIGPLVTHNQCATSDVIGRTAPLLAQASWEVGSPQLRNRATVVGNVVTASPANDTLSPLVALGATVTVQSADGRRVVPIEDFHLGVRRTDLADDELVTAISFPALGPNHRSVYLKLGLRRAQAISVVHLAAVVELTTDGVVVEARLALGSVAATIVRAAEAERLLTGRTIDDQDAIEAAATAAVDSVAPIDDLRAPAHYRRDMVGEMVRRAVEALAAGGGVVPPGRPTLAGAPRPTGTINPDGLDHDATTPIEAVVNGEALTAPGAGPTLLDWLRQQGLTGTKEGCAEGECGACTVHLDGAAVLSCLVPATRAHHAEVVTIEGLGSGPDLHRLQSAFVAAGAVQCGYCIPGFLMSGAKLIDELNEADPDAANLGQSVNLGLSGNLCRCTGYYKIDDAVRVALGPESEDDR
jgi:carbon-monoxide dehydrogenase medium subunit